MGHHILRYERRSQSKRLKITKSLPVPTRPCLIDFYVYSHTCLGLEPFSLTVHLTKNPTKIDHPTWSRVFHAFPTNMLRYDFQYVHESMAIKQRASDVPHDGCPDGWLVLPSVRDLHSTVSVCACHTWDVPLWNQKRVWHLPSGKLT